MSEIIELLEEIKKSAGRSPADIFYYLKAADALALLKNQPEPKCKRCDELQARINELYKNYKVDEIENLKEERKGHIDFIGQLETEIEGLKKSDNILTALEAAGVDNWEGYDEAMTILEDQALTQKDK